MSTWKHKKRGHVYEVVTDNAVLQCSTAPNFEETFEDEDWTVYRNVNTGRVFIRLTEEFLDGRFEEIPDEADGPAVTAGMSEKGIG